LHQQDGLAPHQLEYGQEHRDHGAHAALPLEKRHDPNRLLVIGPPQ
jgi:hypothetical protein